MENTTTMPTLTANDVLDLENRSKILAMFTLGLGSLLAGFLPKMFSRQNRRDQFFISLLLCFGAGVLLATALVHLLPDVRKTMPQNAELYLCAGFFAIYFIDEFIHYFFGEAIQHSHDPPHNHTHSEHSSSRSSLDNAVNSYGATNSETQSLLQNSHRNQQPVTCTADEANARICHTSHTEPCAETRTGALGLLVALSVHSVIEGLAIGLQSTRNGVVLLLVAVACHKYVMSFCLGLEFRMNSNSSIKSYVTAIIIFSFGSVIGIGIGMAIDDLPKPWNNSALPILQALAGGTLLYVTVCEVMPRERARWHQNVPKKYAGIAQFFATVIGFGLMTFIEYYIEH